jgi:putative hemolysin
MNLEILFILVFLVLNGFFAASEIAVVTARKSFVKQLSEEGNHKAAALLKLQSEPDRLLATVQIGVTVMGSITSALGGAAAVKLLKPFLAALPVPFISSAAEVLSIGLTVIVISYFTLVIGELVPKSIALRNPERVGLFVAGPISAIAKISSFFVTILTKSSNLLLSPFGVKAYSERSFISEEEIKLLIEEGRDKGIFERTEQELIHSVFRFTDISVKGVMVPSTQMVAFSVKETAETIITRIAEENFSRYPVFDKDRSDIKGILYGKDVFNELAYKREVVISNLLHYALFVPESMKISTLMREMQKKRLHMAIVVDEYGAVAGLVTIEDLLEEIVGEIRDEYDTETPVQTLKDGTMLIDASMAIRDLNEDYRLDIPESNDYDTLGGYLLSSFQKLPSAGDVLSTDSRKFTIIGMKGRRILKVRAEPAQPAQKESNPTPAP